MHIAAQYLAAAGISILEKQPDDSHTNVGFSVEDRTLFTRPLLSSFPGGPFFGQPAFRSFPDWVSSVA